MKQQRHLDSFSQMHKEINLFSQSFLKSYFYTVSKKIIFETLSFKNSIRIRIFSINTETLFAKK